MEKSSPEDSTGRASAFALAVVCTGLAIGLSWTGFSALGLALVGLAILLSAGGVAGFVPRVPPIILKCVIAAGVAGGFAYLNLGEIFRRDAQVRDLITPFIGLAVVAALLAAGVIFARSRFLIAACFFVLICVHLLMSAIAVTTRQPLIDTYVVQSLGCQALAKGQNPYAITFPDNYGPNSEFYPPGIVINGQVQCGYCYMPLSLLLEFPSYALTGDTRFAHAVALALAAILLAYASPKTIGFAPAAMLLFLPDTFRRLQLAWIEPFVVLTLCATVFFAARKQFILAAIALGLFYASKQYTPFTAPAALLLLPRPWRWKDALKFGSIALISGLAVTLPFVLCDPHAFFHSLTTLYVGSVRFDSISFLPHLAQALHVQASLAFGVAATIPASLLVLWRAPRTTSGFAASVALILMCLFAFSPVAFGNYYSLAASALCAAIAAQDDKITNAASVPPPSSAIHTDQ